MYVVGFAETVVEMLNVRNGLIEVLTHMWVCAAVLNWFLLYLLAAGR